MTDINKLLDIMARLRSPEDGCPWDLEQSFDTIAPYTIEEAYEVADAIARSDLDDLKGELGDLLFQVVFHARLAEEQGAFEFGDVVEAISTKLTRRHPHVFGTAEDRARGAIDGGWEAIKADERASKAGTGASRSALDDVPLSLPALKRAGKLGKRASSVGFDWPNVGGVRAKLDEELAELDEAMAVSDRERVSEELGDLLFAVANLARHLGLDAEEVLHRASRKFESRFRGVEDRAASRGQSLRQLDLDELEALWQAVKAD